MPLKGVLFDMDGLLFDTERVASEGSCLAGEEMGITVTPEILSQLYGGNRENGKAVMKKYFGPDFDYAHHNRLMHDYMERVIGSGEGLRPMPGAAALLPWLKEHGYQTAVASSSNTSTIQRYLEMADFTPYFDAIVGGDQITNSKPAPDIFIAAAAALGLAPGECLALEDSPNGVKSASSAGCVTVMVPDLITPTEELRALCTGIIGSLADVPAFLSAYS